MKPGHITVAPETIASMWDEMQCLLAEHYEEIAADKQAIPLAPNRERYASLEEAGNTFSLSARADGVLIGYSVFFVNTHIHYSRTLVAVNDVIFVSKEFRTSRAGIVLLKESERLLRERGVVKVVWHVKPVLDWSAILERMGYSPLETLYGKLL